VAIRPARLWKDLPPEKRVAAAEAFWTDQDGAEQQAEAIVMLARRLNFRAKSIQSLPLDKRARHLAQVVDVSDTLAGRALVAYHFANKRPLMAAFLEALGIAHEAVRNAFPPDEVDLYLQTLVALDPDTWTALDRMISVNR
jgi:hypothetical protein